MKWVDEGRQTDYSRGRSLFETNGSTVLILLKGALLVVPVCRRCFVLFWSLCFFCSIPLRISHVGCGVSLVESRRLFNFQELAPSIGRSLGEIRGNQEGKSPMEMGSKRQFWVHKKANKKMEV